jgi:hypothetical protein
MREWVCYCGLRDDSYSWGNGLGEVSMQKRPQVLFGVAAALCCRAVRDY